MEVARRPAAMEKLYTAARFKWDSVCTNLGDLHIDVEITDDGYIYYIPRDIFDLIQLCDESCSDCAEPQLIFRIPL